MREILSLTLAAALAAGGCASVEPTAFGLYRQGVDAYRASQYPQAVTYLTQAIEQDPKAKYYSLRAWALAKQGYLTDAMQDADQAITLEPTQPRGYYDKAGFHAVLGDHQPACDFLRQAMERGVGPDQIRTDPDLDRLDGVPCYEAIVAP